MRHYKMKRFDYKMRQYMVELLFFEVGNISHCVKSAQIRSFSWSVFGHFSRSAISEAQIDFWMCFCRFSP